jgi:hypothetical protein
MGRIQGATIVERSVEEVFDFVADELNETMYNPLMVHAEKTTPGPIGVGTRWSATILARGRPLDMDIEVTEYDRPHRLGSLTRTSAADVDGLLVFEPDPAGTRLAWSWELRPKGALRLVGPLLGVGRQQEAELWADLKAYLESKAARSGPQAPG